MRLSLIGSGYVGIVTGACFSSLGHDVTLVDVVEEKVRLINSGIPTVYEKDLDTLVSGGVKRGTLSATNHLESAVASTEITFICVGTPSRQDGTQDTQYIEKVSEEIGASLKNKDGYHIVIVKSTVLPGTTIQTVGKIIEMTSGKKAGRDFGLGMNPEFLKEGDAVSDFMKPDRIVVGYNDDRTRDFMQKLYAPLDVPMLFTDCTTAEMIKYASNVFLSARVALINELGNVAKRIGVDIRTVSKAVGMDRRIGPFFLNAGAGFGGSCFRKDASAISLMGRKLGAETPIIDAVLSQNEKQPLKLLELLEKHGPVSGRTVAVLGLAFKPDSDDIREAPSIKVVSALIGKGAKVVAYDPAAMENFKKLFPAIDYAESATAAVARSDAVVVVTEWKEFSDQELYGRRLVVDGRGVTKTKNYEGICW
ncbi:MAG: UDP-glucose/GDP-mannose dehydrogenase family protein [Methanomassiliicoccales archaeon]|nr:UDP-glucose/GDP-mannose dehydrogenase family protein [Methanomassiliicoccales archaeon]